MCLSGLDGQSITRIYDMDVVEKRTHILQIVNIYWNIPLTSLLITSMVKPKVEI
jgi:hypothetical protein